jgi:hypothetical protein
MIELFMTFVVFLSVVTIMAVGVIRGRAPISGSCGGLNNIGVDGACDICGGNPNQCETPDSVLVEAQRSVKATNIMKA